MMQRDLDRLSADLRGAGAAVVPAMARVVKKGLQNIKDDTVSNISRHPSWKRLAPTVGYDVSSLGGLAGLSGEVGYDDRGQGELAGIYEFGSSRRAPHPTLSRAFEREGERFPDQAARAVDQVLGRGGL